MHSCLTDTHSSSYSRERNETTEANRLCTECKRDFCEQCAQRHSNVPAFKQHSIITMPTGNMASLRYCGSHSDELLMYNCLTCDQFVCSLCITDTHNTCQVHSVSEVSTHMLGFIYIGPESDIDSRWVYRESNLVFTLSIDKDQTKT